MKLRTLRKIAPALAAAVGVASCATGVPPLAKDPGSGSAPAVPPMAAAKPGARRVFAAPSNDAIENATVLAAIPFSAPLDTTEASYEPENPFSIGIDVWYAFTPTTTGKLILRVPSAPSGAALAIFTGTYPDLTQVEHTHPAYVELDAVAGTTYLIAIRDVGASSFQVDVPPPPPSNDNFADAAVIGSLPYANAVDIGEATPEPNDPPEVQDANVWYRITPTVSGKLFFDASASEFFPAVQAYTGTHGSLVTVPGAINGSKLVTFDATAGTTYHVVARGRGRLVMNVTSPPAPPNDAIASATVIPALPFATSVDVTGATQAGDEPASPCAETAPNSVWYAYTPPTPTVLRLDTAGSSYQPTISTFTGALGALSPVLCDGGTDHLVSLAAGQTYYIRLSGYAFEGPTQLALSAAGTAPLANDEPDGAIDVGALPFSVSQDTRFATWGALDPRCDPFSSQRASVWYRFTPATDLPVEAATSGSDFPTSLTVWNGKPGTPGADYLGCGDANEEGTQPRLRFDAVAGRTYYVMAGSLSSRSGTTLGGNLVLSGRELLPPKPVITIDQTASLNARTNVLTVSGSVRSVNPASGFVYGSATQRVGRGELTGSSPFLPIDNVGPNGTRWVVEIPGDGKWAGGKATVAVGMSLSNDDGSVSPYIEGTTVRVVGK